MIYENGAAKLWQTEAGYISMNDSKYHYYLQDHQGNNRIVVNETGTTEEVNHYYAFGGLFSSDESVQPFKYNGKELDTKKGLNWYDYGARQYDAALGRWFAVDPLAEKYYNVSPYTFTGNYGFNVREVNGGLFIFVNGFDPLEYGINLTKYPLSFINFLAGDLTYIPKREFKNSDSYGWGKIDDLYKEKYKEKEDENSLYIDGSMGVSYPAAVRYNRGIKSGMELIKKIRSGEYKLEEDETIKIIGYSMGGAYAAGMAYAFAQDPEYKYRLAFIDYLAPFQPERISHPDGVLGRQFASLDDYFNTYIKIKNVSVHRVRSFGEFKNLYDHSLCKELRDFLEESFNNSIPIYIYE